MTISLSTSFLNHKLILDLQIVTFYTYNARDSDGDILHHM